LREDVQALRALSEDQLRRMYHDDAMARGTFTGPDVGPELYVLVLHDHDERH
jgi:hypothetical protein